MRIFRPLLVVQSLSALLLSAILIYSLLIYSSHQIRLTQEQTRNAVTQIISHHITGDGKILSRQLDRTFPLQSLRISQLDHTLLHEQHNVQQQTPVAHWLLSLAGADFSAQHVTDAEHNIQVHYLLDLTAQLKQFSWFALCLLVLPFTLIWLPALVSKAMLNREYRQTALQTHQLIERFIEDPQKNEPAWHKIPPVFSEISRAIQKLAAYTQKQYNDMNAAAKLIEEEAYRDHLTGLPNRNRFVQYYEEQLSHAITPASGAFAITRCTELQNLNQTRCYQEGDRYIQDVAAILKKVTSAFANSRIYRLNGSDFGILLPDLNSTEADNFAMQLQSNFNDYQQQADLDSVAYTGMVMYESGKVLGELLAIADTAISLAQTKQANAWHLHKESSGLEAASHTYGNQNWRNVIDDVLTNSRLSLLIQPIQASDRSASAYEEILVRFKTQDNQILPTASFLAMSEKLDRIIAVDRLIIETALTIIKAKSLQEKSFGLNLSARSVHDDQFVIWLERRLLKDAQIASKLVFEVNEFGLQQNLKTSKRFIDMLHRSGSRITVEKFGAGITSFKFFRDLKPDFVKMDGSYSRHIDEDKNNQYFMRLMIDLAHRLGVGVFAESVETETEKMMLESLFIDGIQGYYIGKPVSM
ncbi:EAL domain-containing protein [Chromatiaceae bacterium AAb-1]|nr:EAL domain-containing protein [Chromatiaceae bacterium AAb-1]